ncbi:ATP-binding protein [Trichocoleus sp. ST-U3]|uniref:AAA family ATPase n=1 Tax=Coleofasciculus sp. FACHB-542 TaxID=2692787 RepID=UPI001684C07B|nr:AAA family ATPase [Coleofasciculus sp. FACHB-542]MBD2083624.1 AAA family ATPase [Coleofasciculus sp. FACHB-542]
MQLVIFIGLQASGKSTFYHTHFAETHKLVSKDLLRNNKNRSRRQTQLIKEAFEIGQSVVVDNTNPTVEERASLIELGCMYSAEIIGYYFKSSVSQCRERNQQRLGKAQVPDVAIYATIKKLQRPSSNEGFHQLFYVRMAGDLTFEVRAWTKDEVADG